MAFGESKKCTKVQGNILSSGDRAINTVNSVQANVLLHVSGVGSVLSLRHSLSQMITPNTVDMSHIPLQQQKPTH